MVKKPVDIVFIDWSGTLVNDFKKVYSVGNRVREFFGYATYNLEDKRMEIFNGGRCNAYLDMNVGLPEIDKKYIEFFEESKLTSEPYPGVKAALDELSRNGKKIIVVSQHMCRFLEKEAKDFGIRNRFTEVICKSPGRWIDKELEMRKMLRKYGVSNTNAVFVGDTINDLVGARNVNIDSIATCWGYMSKTVLQKYDPIGFIEKDFTELLDYIH